MMAQGQPGGDPPRTPEEANFLSGITRGVSAWSLPDVQLGSFTVLARMKPIVVTLNVPGNRRTARHLHAPNRLLERRPLRPSLGR